MGAGEREPEGAEPRQPVPADAVQSAELPRGLAACSAAAAGERLGLPKYFAEFFSLIKSYII